MPTYQSFDPATGALTYTYATQQVPGTIRVITATDYDTEQAQPWSSYRLDYNLDGFGWYSLKAISAVFDDGSSFTFENLFTYTIGGGALDHGDRTTSRDTLGRVDHVHETYEAYPVPHSGMTEFDARSTDYDVTTGNRDYQVTSYRDGRVESIDFTAATGSKDYEHTAYRDGHAVSTDYDAAGRADFIVTTYADGRRISQDIDPVTGRVDYQVAQDATGAHVDTDYDLSDVYSWNTYTVSYGPDGSVLNVAIA